MFDLQNIILSALIVALPILTYVFLSNEIFEALLIRTTNKYLKSILAFFVPIIVMGVFITIEIKFDVINEMKTDWFFSYYTLVSIIEETIKICVALIFLKIFKHSIVDDEKTSLWAFLLAWLTFWVIENIIYYAGYTWQNLTTFIIVRQTIDIPVHLLFSMISYYAIMWILENGWWKNKSFKDYSLAIFCIVFPHMSFNSALDSGGNYVLFSLLMALVWIHQGILFFSWENIYQKKYDSYGYD